MSWWRKWQNHNAKELKYQDERNLWSYFAIYHTDFLEFFSLFQISVHCVSVTAENIYQALWVVPLKKIPHPGLGSRQNEVQKDTQNSSFQRNPPYKHLPNFWYAYSFTPSAWISIINMFMYDFFVNSLCSLIPPLKCNIYCILFLHPNFILTFSCTYLKKISKVSFSNFWASNND